jgi:phosphatidyl-myo-inositol alpha-mannosyltransferase
MKIALVCPYDWSLPGGVRDHVANLADVLADTHDVRILAPASQPVDDPRVEAIGKPRGVRFNRSVAPIALSPLSGRHILASIEDFDPHIIHVHEPLAPALSASVTGFAEGAIIGTFHTWSDRRLVYRASAPIARRMVDRLAVRVAVSPAAQQYAAGALKLPMGAFRVLPNGVDAARFAAAEPLPDLVDPDRPLVLFVGRLEPRKGLAVLIRGFLRLRATVPRARLCVVGEGPERVRCQEMVPPSIRPDVLFVGRVGHAELPRYHASADLFVSPATGGESFGIVLLEAMAAGLPVVASDIPGYRTVMKDARQGRLVRPDDGVALAEAMESLLGNDKLRTAMAAEGRETAARYAWPVVGRQIGELYREVHAARE